MSSQSVDYIKTEIINDDSMNDSSMLTFDVESIPFFDDKEDACTQTYTTESFFVQELPNLNISFDESEETDTTDVSLYETSQVSFSPLMQRKTSLCWKNKTPKTLKMLKEKHRENERLRHHSLNQHLRLICKKVPGSAENGKETKVVMMQRIISYIAYLENTISCICSQLGVKSNPSWRKLTSSIKDMDKSETWSKEFLAMRSEDSRGSEEFSRNISRLLKLSSPTIDTTTTCPSPRLDCNQQKSQDPCLEREDTTSTTCSKDIIDESIFNGWQWLVPDEEVVNNESANFEAMLNINNFDHMFDLPSSTYEKKSDKQFGFDPHYCGKQPCELLHSVTISPDQVIPGTIIKQELGENDELSALDSSLNTNVPKECVDLKTRQRQSNLRTPLLNITNWLEIPLEMNEMLVGSDSCFYKQKNQGSEIVGSNSTQEATHSQTYEVTKTDATSGTNNDMAINDKETRCERILTEPCGDRPSKFDLRKSSWMNGFMMYSHIHRKQLIRENPGLHVSVISKMMGLAWRGMTSEQQQPYREQAQFCSQELHKILKGTCH